MKKKNLVLTRRQMLRGLGGAAVGLPLLPSLLPGRAYAQDATLGQRPRFVAMATNHGGIDESAMFPSESWLTEETSLYPGLRIRSGALRRAVTGSEAYVSSILRAPSQLLTDRLVSKMNVLWGLDIPFYIAHHTGGHLGNYARNDGNGDAGQAIQLMHMPTIDQLMAWSPSFYPSLNGVTQRSIIAGTMGRTSWNFSNPSARSGSVEEVRGTPIARELFDRIFPSSQPRQPTRQPIVDRVLQAYSSLRQSNRRMSADDRQRLDDHMDRLSELERRLNTHNVSCDTVNAPRHVHDALENYALLIDVITTAFACGASRIAVLGITEEHYERYAGDWHQEVAHQHSLQGPQSLLQSVNRAVFRHVFLELASRLDAIEEEPGVTVLDRTLMAWSQESGDITHEARSIPVVTFGSAAGFLRTGLFCDYRNRTRALPGRERGHTGLLYNQWLATCLQAMGVPRSEWQSIPHNGSAGYGLLHIDSQYAATHVAGVVENASQPLPLLT